MCCWQRLRGFFTDEHGETGGVFPLLRSRMLAWTGFGRGGFKTNLSRSGKSEFPNDGVVEVSLHSGEVGFALQYDISIAFAGQHVPPRRRQHCVLILPSDQFQGALTLGDISHLPAMEADIIGSLEVDR